MSRDNPGADDIVKGICNKIFAGEGKQRKRMHATEKLLGNHLHINLVVVDVVPNVVAAMMKAIVRTGERKPAARLHQKKQSANRAS